MTFEAYTTGVLSTESPVNIPEAQFQGAFIRQHHAVLGLVTEGIELLEWVREGKSKQNLLEELGDACWYAALLGHLLGPNWAISDLFNTAPDESWENLTEWEFIDMYVAAAGNMLDMHKKYLFYPREINTDKYITEFRAVIASILALAHFLSLTIEQVWEANNRKLLGKDGGRYAAGLFSTEAAIERNVEGEMESMGHA